MISRTMHYNKIIFHVDVNSAFLSWTAVKKLKEDPSALDLRTVPSVICGDVETRHGIVTAKSIPAKKYGIKTAEPVMSAIRKCPNLILEKSDFATYREYSHKFTEILRSHSDAVEKASIDEAYVDMTETICERHRRTTENEEPITEALIIAIATRIKDEIFEKLGFTVNIGISINKLLAKMASDFEKPDKVHTLWPKEVPEKMWPMDIGDLFGCGGATSSRLKSLEIMTIGDAAREESEVLQSYLGEKTGSYIWQSANGIGSDHVHVELEDAKSYSNETTLSHDITPALFGAEAPQVVRELAESVSGRLKRDGVFALTIGIMVKTSGFKRLSRQMTLEESTNDVDVIYHCAYQLLRKLAFGENSIRPGSCDLQSSTETKITMGALSGEDYRMQQTSPGSLFSSGDGIRLIGVGAAKLDRGEYRQVSMFDYLSEVGTEEDNTSKCSDKSLRINEMLKNIRQKYGENSVTTGADLLE